MTNFDFQALNKVGKKILASGYLSPFKLLEIQTFGYDVETTDNLEKKVLEESRVCIVTRPDDLLLENIKFSRFTPIFYACNEEEQKTLVENGQENLEDKLAKYLSEKNLYAFIDFNSPAIKINEVLSLASKDRDELLEKLQKLPAPLQKELLQKNYSQNTFRNFFQDVRTVYEEQKFLDDDARLVRLIEDYTNNPDERTEKLAAEQARQILMQYKTGQRHNSRLGAGLSSEPGSTNRLGKIVQGTARTHALRWRVFRVVEGDRSGHNHYEIAQQRYEDAFSLQKYYGFKTPAMLRPLDLSKLDEKDQRTFLLMQEVEGPTLNDVLRRIQTEVDSLEEKVSQKDTSTFRRIKQLSALRSALVNKYARDIAAWQNAGLVTFVKKPNGKSLIEEYKQRISTFPEILEVVCPGLYDIDAEGNAYLESRNILDDLGTSLENIVRVRDASLPNAALQFDKVKYAGSGQVELTMSDIEKNLLIPGKENGNSVDTDKIESSFYNLDLHYRYGHIFEDLAHLTTEAECAFLVHGEKGFNVKGVRKLFYDFVDRIDRADLKEDEKSVYLMLNYRSQRKLSLYASAFALNSIDEFEKGNITKQRLDRRLKMFERNIRNHARSCEFLSGRLRSIFASECVDRQERSHVSKWYKEAKLSYGPEFAKRYLDEVRLLKDPSARAYWHACVSELTNEKLVHYLNKKSLYFEGLKNANKTRLL